jgi:hypothetical protein
VHLDHLRKRAKDRLRETRLTDPDARLARAQREIAREQGFASWPRMKAYADRLAAHPDGLQLAYHDDPGYYAGRAEGLLASARDGTPSAVATLRRAGVPMTAAGARTAVARAHGFPSWPALRRHVRGLSASGEPFRRAFVAIEAHDVDALVEVLERWPAVASAEGTNGNDLLAMATATGDERTVGVLLGAGADPSHQNAHGWTALHQVGYADAVHLVAPLLAAGARSDLSARGDGGTPLVAALFWGHRAVPDALVAARGVEPENLRAAAGTGDVELVERLLDTAGAGAHRGFYRPHSGFPAWRPADERQEVLDEALTYAARAGRVDVLGPLVAAGARVDADVYRGTPLIWAASRGRADAVRRLLELGADPTGRGGYGGATHGHDVTPLHLAGVGGDEEPVRVLLAGGARTDVEDGHGYGTPAGWARHEGHEAVARVIEGG